MFPIILIQPVVVYIVSVISLHNNSTCILVIVCSTRETKGHVIVHEAIGMIVAS